MTSDADIRQRLNFHVREASAHNREASKLRKQLRERKRKNVLGLPKRKKGRGCRLSDRDEAVKAERGYTDPSTFVRRDGSEVLKGVDWTNRKGELRERSGGICEYLTDNFACFKTATIPAHVNPRHPKRDDRMSNLMHYCFEHDRLTEKQGWRKTRFGEGQK